MQKLSKSVGLWALLLAIFIAYMAFSSNTSSMLYSDLVRYIKDGQVTQMEITDNDVVVRLKDSTEALRAEIPSYEALAADVGEDNFSAQLRNGTLVTKVNHSKISVLGIISYVLPLVLVIVLFSFFMRKNSRANPFTKSPAKIEADSGKRVRFSDVAGADEEKGELEELVEFLKNPQKFIALGARIPKGVLLVGPPGTGKTLLARAIAGEADVPFFSISGSDFVELYVGVGASRVRDLFETAKKSRPCIIFIDEIDAVGRKRGAGMGGGHDEREQTLNQLLVEMDGFGENEGVIMIAATNRPDILDPALLRPGRFDRQVVVNLPDIKGREEILKIHSRKKPLDKAVSLSDIARATAGYSGADLENLMNEAAIFAARREHIEITTDDVSDANLKVMMGTEKRSRVMSAKEKKLTAYHEAGHAVLGRLVSVDSQVSQVSIIPRGRAGGFTMQLPTEDKMYQTRNEMLSDIVMMLGGRCAEELMLDDISTGASNDLERATKLARAYVSKYGMSEAIGPVAYDTDEEVFLGRDFAHSKAYSDKTAADIDNEVKSIMSAQYKTALEMLGSHKNTLSAVAELLLEKETINSDEFEACFSKAEAQNNEILG